MSHAENETAPEVHPILSLRDMTMDDVDAITELDRQLFGVDCWPRNMFVDELAQPKTRRYIIAEHTGADAVVVLTGYAGLMCIPPIGDIQTIGVLPKFEGQGIARAMLDLLVEETARRGAKSVMLEVSASNPRAQKLYERYGFEHIHKRPKYYQDGSDALIMNLNLAQNAAQKDFYEHP